MPDDELLEENKKKEKKPGLNIMGLLLSIVFGALAGGGISFALITLLGSNTPSSSNQTAIVTAAIEIKVRFIVEGSFQSFILKGGRDVIIIDLLSFTVGSDGCREEISKRNDQIMSALQDLFIQKESSEMSNSAGLDLLKRQIRDLVNRITGFVGDKAKYGAIEVYDHIKAITSVQ